MPLSVFGTGLAIPITVEADSDGRLTPGHTEDIMERSTIQGWTRSQVPLKFGNQRAVKYRVYRDGSRHYQEICEPDGAPIHTLELPAGMKLDRGSYEVLLRYVLIDVVAA